MSKRRPAFWDSVKLWPLSCIVVTLRIDITLFVVALRAQHPSAFPPGQEPAFSPQELAARFGSSNAKYAWNVFAGHRDRLKQSGYDGACRISRSALGKTSGRRCSGMRSRRARKLIARGPLGRIPNARTGSDAWRECASDLLGSIPADALLDNKTKEVIHAVAGAISFLISTTKSVHVRGWWNCITAGRLI